MSAEDRRTTGYVFVVMTMFHAPDFFLFNVASERTETTRRHNVLEADHASDGRVDLMLSQGPRLAKGLARIFRGATG